MRVVTNLMIPLLAVLLIYAGRGRSRTVLIRVCIALAWAYLLHFLDRALGIWASGGLDYSTHTAVAIAIGTTLAALGRAWMTAAVAIWIAYATLMIRVPYHSLEDILSTAGVNLPIAIGAQFLPRRQTVEA